MRHFLVPPIVSPKYLNEASAIRNITVLFYYSNAFWCNNKELDHHFHFHLQRKTREREHMNKERQRQKEIREMGRA